MLFGSEYMNFKVLNNAKVRNVIYQVLLVAVVVAVVLFLVINAGNNLAKQGIASGFGFLQLSTGFDIASSLIHYDESSTYLRLFFAALINTLLMSFVSIVFATIIGFSIGIMRMAEHPLVAKIAAVYVETLRNIPLLLQVFFWYFAVLQPLPSPRSSLAFWDGLFINNRGMHLPSPILDGNYLGFLASLMIAVGLLIYFLRQAKSIRILQGQSQPKSWWLSRLLPISIILIIIYFTSGTSLHWSVPALQGFNFEGGWVISPEFFALFIALSTYTGAYIAENVRSGIQSIKKGQIEAGRSLGLNSFQIMRFIIIPNALRVIIPPLTNQYLNLTKNSSLAAAIAYPDLVLVFAGTALNQTGQAVEILLMIMLVYLLISLLISAFMNWYNSHVKIVER